MNRVLRPATLADGAEATELLRRLGLVMPSGEQAVAAHWRRLWLDNPALSHDGADPLPGWVLEADGRMVGFFANYAQTYWQGDQRLTVAIASQWGVEKPHRDATGLLSDAYFAQPNVDMILVTTGIKATGRLFQRYGGLPVPQPGLDRVRFWVTDAGAFLAASLRKKGWPGAGPARHLRLPVGLTWPGAPRRAVTVDSTATFDSRFDRLFAAKRRERPDQLFADRTAPSLAWHVLPHADRDGLRVLAIDRPGELDGYAILIRDDAKAIGLTRWRLADLLVREDDPAMVADLVGAAVRLAAAEGAALLEVGGVAQPLQATIMGLGGLTRPLPTWPCYYRTCTEQSDVGAWYLTAYDGDTVLF
ncbi:hypothetical protein [Magnetospirillum moscoviense]|uniref:Uncharacterized protein n=1 Tax=Magnetospirillum moscoviense TaxID=1437059 RepID=A0A178MVM9_9PROT|nr:hypothetical protein [Magnetospirillum moscoviense]OAN53087.1 hypothetical protein A6A05_10000 [Magnetospirillum moscoviense]